MVHAVQEKARIGTVGANQGRVEGAVQGGHAVHHGRTRHDVDLEIDAHALELRLDHLGGQFGNIAGERGVEEGQHFAILGAVAVVVDFGVAHLLQQLDGPVRVVGEHVLNAGVVELDTPREQLIRHRIHTLEHDLVDFLPIDGVHEGLPHPNVIRGRVGGVEVNAPGQAHLGGAQHRSVRVPLHAVHSGGRHFVDDQDFAGLQGGEARFLFQDEAEHHRLQVGRTFMEDRGPPVVVVVPFQHNLVARNLADELERPRTNQRIAEVVAVFLHRLLGNDAHEGRRQRKREERVGGFEGHLQGCVVNDLGARVGTQQGTGLLRLGCRILHAVEIELDHAGRERTAVMERHVVAQRQGPLGCIVGRFPGRGQPGHVIGIVVQVNQAVEDVPEHIGGLGEGAGVRIERVVVHVANANGQGAGAHGIHGGVFFHRRGIARGCDTACHQYHGGNQPDPRRTQSVFQHGMYFSRIFGKRSRAAATPPTVTVVRPSDRGTAAAQSTILQQRKIRANGPIHPMCGGKVTKLDAGASAAMKHRSPGMSLVSTVPNAPACAGPGHPASRRPGC